MSKNLCQTICVVVLASLASAACAQVFNAPAPQPKAPVQQAAVPAGAAPAGAVEQTGWDGVPLPKVTLPKITMPKITMPNMESITGPVKSGFSKVSAGTKKAWEGTKEMLSFGQNKAPAAAGASAQKKPSLWQRLVARNPEPQVPQTVGEFMSQPRLDP